MRGKQNLLDRRSQRHANVEGGGLQRCTLQSERARTEEGQTPLRNQIVDRRPGWDSFSVLANTVMKGEGRKENDRL